MNLRDELMGLQELLNDETILKRQLIKEIEADAKKFGDERRTLLEEAQKASVSVAVVDEPMSVIVSKNGWVRARTGHQIEVDTLTFKQGDELAGDHATFGEQRAALFERVAKVALQSGINEDNRLAKQCAVFRAADVEHVGDFG